MSAMESDMKARAHKGKGWTLSLVIVLGGWLALIAPVISTASAAEAGSNTFGDWTMLCVDESAQQEAMLPPCEIVQTVRERGQPQPALRLAFAFAGEIDVYGMHLTLPGDIRASAGLVMKLDDSIALDYTILRCERDVCFSEKVMLPGEMVPLKEAHKGFVAMVDQNGGLERIPLSFEGFTDALAEMINRNREWAELRLAR